MASPHVTCVGVLYQCTYGTTSSAAITNWINANATTNKITGNPSSTVNYILNQAGL